MRNITFLTAALLLLKTAAFAAQLPASLCENDLGVYQRCRLNSTLMLWGRNPPSLVKNTLNRLEAILKIIPRVVTKSDAGESAYYKLVKEAERHFVIVALKGELSDIPRMVEIASTPAPESKRYVAIGQMNYGWALHSSYAAFALGAAAAILRRDLNAERRLKIAEMLAANPPVRKFLNEQWRNVEDEFPEVAAADRTVP